MNRHVPKYWRTTTMGRANTLLHQVFANAKSSSKARKKKIGITLAPVTKGYVCNECLQDCGGTCATKR